MLNFLSIIYNSELTHFSEKKIVNDLLNTLIHCNIYNTYIELKTCGTGD